MIPVRFGKLDIELLDFAIHLSEVLENVWFPIVLIFEWLVCSRSDFWGWLREAAGE